MRARHAESALQTPDGLVVHGTGLDPSWHDFRVFFAEMGSRPAGMSLDRIDPRGPYSRANCRWASLSRQRHNQVRERRHALKSLSPEAWTSRQSEAEQRTQNLSGWTDYFSAQLGRDVPFESFVAAHAAFGLDLLWAGLKSTQASAVEIERILNAQH